MVKTRSTKSEATANSKKKISSLFPEIKSLPNLEKTETGYEYPKEYLNKYFFIRSDNPDECKFVYLEKTKPREFLLGQYEIFFNKILEHVDETYIPKNNKEEIEKIFDSFVSKDYVDNELANTQLKVSSVLEDYSSEITLMKEAVDSAVTKDILTSTTLVINKKIENNIEAVKKRLTSIEESIEHLMEKTSNVPSDSELIKISNNISELKAGLAKYATTEIVSALVKEEMVKIYNSFKEDVADILEKKTQEILKTSSYNPNGTLKLDDLMFLKKTGYASDDLINLRNSGLI